VSALALGALCDLVRQPGRFNVESAENTAKLEAVEALAVLAVLAEQAGITLIELALGFVLAHPAVTAPIIGPRALSQLEDQLGAADTLLSADVLDEIDKIVPPGITLSTRDAGYVPPGLRDAALRRRASGGRATEGAAAGPLTGHGPGTRESHVPGQGERRPVGAGGA
jgi:hypothetical protein